MRTSVSLLGILLFASTWSLQAQDSCKVLVENLKGSYSGGCKKGLAHGRGTAIGIDTYMGFFKKGYPNGTGRYVWATGPIYEGNWRKGVRNGEGTYTYMENGKEIVQSGIWLNDVFKGPKPIPPKVIFKENISSVSFVRMGDGKEINIKVIRNGVPQIVTFDYASSNAGNIYQNGTVAYYQNVNFPFTCKIIYYLWNSTHTYVYRCKLEISVIQPGNWEVKVYNSF